LETDWYRKGIGHHIKSKLGDVSSSNGGGGRTRRRRGMTEVEATNRAFEKEIQNGHNWEWRR